MKEIDLIKYESHSIEVPPEAIGLQGVEGKCSVEFSKKRLSEMARVEIKNPNTGEIIGVTDVTDGDNKLMVARKNGSQVIYATILIENQLNDIITNYLFGKFMPNPGRDFFVNDILCTSHITFAAKKALTLRIIDNLKLFGSCSNQDSRRKKNINTKKAELDKLLVKVIIYRNAFAHGKLRHEATRGCVLHYYSGGHKEHALDDDFWIKIEEEYASIDETLRKIINSMLLAGLNHET